MGVAIPKQKLPFASDDETAHYILPDGNTYTLTKQEYFDKLAALQHVHAAKAAEHARIDKECRQQLDALLYPDGYPTKENRQDGTDKYELPGGWTLEFERRINVKIDEAQLQSIEQEIAKLPIDPESGEVPTIGSAIRHRPELSMSAYGNLRDDVRVILNQALTFTPGTPGVKFVAPKPKAAAKANDQKAQAK
jgi:hypothetical protein